jgi:hypothetical protein
MLSLIAVTFLFETMAFASLEVPDVVINEIMYHPASEDVREEFVELHNRRSTAIDLTGWRLTQVVRFSFPANTVMPPCGYLVVVADPVTFSDRHPGIVNYVGGWEGILSNNGETLDLQNAAAEVVDRVQFAAEGDWAIRARGPEDRAHRGWIWTAGHDGGGLSLELVNPALPNDYGQNWTSSLVTWNC